MQLWRVALQYPASQKKIKEKNIKINLDYNIEVLAHKVKVLSKILKLENLLTCKPTI